MGLIVIIKINLPDLQKRLVLYLGLFRFSEGNHKEAKRLWGRLGELEPELKQTTTNVYSRLQHVLSYPKRQALVSPEETMKEFKKQMRFVLLLGDLHYQNEDWSRAQKSNSANSANSLQTN